MKSLFRRLYELLHTFCSRIIASVQKPPTVRARKGQEVYRFDGKKVQLSDEEWKRRLTPEQYRILRKGGTERAFYNAYHDKKEEGIYECAGCGLPLYHSDSKYDSSTGWPSFFTPLCNENVSLSNEHGDMHARTEVICRRCGGHLGHLFHDGPPPTGMRYCMNSGAMKFIPKR